MLRQTALLSISLSSDYFFYYLLYVQKLKFVVLKFVCRRPTTQIDDHECSYLISAKNFNISL